MNHVLSRVIELQLLPFSLIKLAKLNFAHLTIAKMILNLPPRLLIHKFRFVDVRLVFLINALSPVVFQPGEAGDFAEAVVAVIVPEMEEMARPQLASTRDLRLFEAAMEVLFGPFVYVWRAFL